MTVDVTEQLAALARAADMLARHDRARRNLVGERDTLIRQLTAAGVGATTVARAAGVSTTLVYKVTADATGPRPAATGHRSPFPLAPRVGTAVHRP